MDRLFREAAFLAVITACVVNSCTHAFTHVTCDINQEERLAIQAKALLNLRLRGFKLVETGFSGVLSSGDGGQVAGNPNTLYSFAGFNDSSKHLLIPSDYPTPTLPPSSPQGPPRRHPTEGLRAIQDSLLRNGSHAGPPPVPIQGTLGVSYQRHEALVMLFCTPPPAKYYGLTGYITMRLLVNDSVTGRGDGDVIVHMPLVEVAPSLNYLSMNTSSGPAGGDRRKQDPKSFFSSAALVVASSSREMYEAIAEAFVHAGLAPHATNFYPLSAQTVRMHDRSKSTFYDYPDLVMMLSRTSYFDNTTAGAEYGNRHWPVWFLRAPDNEPKYQVSVPAQKFLNDVSGDSEEPLLPTLEQLLDAVTSKTTAAGARLIKREQLVPVPNDKETQTLCLNNNTFSAAVDPLMTNGGCGFGTRDCRYGTSPALRTPFARNRFFVVAGVKHEELGHSSYSSIMLTSLQAYEERNHTITLRETDGAGAPETYLPDVPDASKLFMVTLARECPRGDQFCLEYTEDQFPPTAIVYWMERAYLQRSTGVAPNIHEYVMSFVLTFEGDPVMVKEARQLR